jgi:hypothetical protein
MKNWKLITLSLTIVTVLAFAAGCGSSDSKSQQPAQQQDMHAGHSMPSGDPVPMMKDMDKSLQDMMKQVKAGQMMDAQKSAGQIASIAEKVMPHMANNALKEQLQKAAYDLRDTVNGGKVDQTVVESKMKTMQDVMGQALKDLQSGSHNH